MVLVLPLKLDQVLSLEHNALLRVLDCLTALPKKLNHLRVVEDKISPHNSHQVVVLEHAQLVIHPFLELLTAGRVILMLLVEYGVKDITLFRQDAEEKGVVTGCDSLLVIALCQVLRPISAQNCEAHDQKSADYLNVDVLGGNLVLLGDFFLRLLAHVLNEET